MARRLWSSFSQSFETVAASSSLPSAFRSSVSWYNALIAASILFVSSVLTFESQKEVTFLYMYLSDSTLSFASEL